MPFLHTVHCAFAKAADYRSEDFFFLQLTVCVRGHQRKGTGSPQDTNTPTKMTAEHKHFEQNAALYSQQKGDRRRSQTLWPQRNTVLSAGMGHHSSQNKNTTTTTWHCTVRRNEVIIEYKHSDHHAFYDQFLGTVKS